MRNQGLWTGVKCPEQLLHLSSLPLSLCSFPTQDRNQKGSKVVELWHVKVDLALFLISGWMQTWRWKQEADVRTGVKCPRLQLGPLPGPLPGSLMHMQDTQDQVLPLPWSCLHYNFWSNLQIEGILLLLCFHFLVSIMFLSGKIARSSSLPTSIASPLSSLSAWSSSWSSSSPYKKLKRQ